MYFKIKIKKSFEKKSSMLNKKNEKIKVFTLQKRYQ